MDCKRFEEFLGDFLTETLTGLEVERCNQHLACCESCSRLIGLIRGEINPPSVEEMAARTASVLDKTSGSVCNRVRDLLVDFVDDQLAGEIRDSVGDHLIGCRNCSELATILRSIKEELPLLACLEPGSNFTDSVIRSTTAAAHSPARSAAYRDREWRGVRKLWWMCLRRPRFSWEAAYVGALVTVLVVGGPLSGVLQQVAGAPLASVRMEVSTKIDSTSVEVAERAGDFGCQAQAWTEQAAARLKNERQTLRRTLGSLEKRVVFYAKRTGERAGSWLKDLERALSSGSPQKGP